MYDHILPPEAIQEFKELYFKRYDIELSGKEAAFFEQIIWYDSMN